MLLTTTRLKEVILEGTNEEILQGAKETHRKATKGVLTFSSVHETVPSSLKVKKSCYSHCSLIYALIDFKNMRPIYMLGVFMTLIKKFCMNQQK